MMGPHSQVKSTVARPPAGGRGARGGQSQQRKNKNQKCALVIAFESLWTNEIKKKNFSPPTPKDSLHSLDITPSLDLKPKEKQIYFCDLVSGLYVFVFSSLTFGLVFEFG